MSEQSGRNERDRPPRSGSAGTSRSQREAGADLLGDLQRWLIRSSAKNVRRELEDQVRRTIGRPDRADVWDVATTEIPPDVGEAPECQWCPICRAARRMRDSRPGLAGQLSGVGETVATAMQDAISAVDSLLTGSRGTGGAAARRSSGDARTGSPPEGARARLEPGPATAATGPRPDSLAADHGQAGCKPGDRLATAGPAAAGPWATVTDSDCEFDGTDSASASDQ